MFLNRLSAAEQVAAHLREELARGRWSGTMPGQAKLAKELAVSRVTAEAALRQLETEGLLIGQGPGRSRLIPESGENTPKPLRVAILLHERNSDQQGYMIELRHALAHRRHLLGSREGLRGVQLLLEDAHRTLHLGADGLHGLHGRRGLRCRLLRAPGCRSAIAWLVTS